MQVTDVVDLVRGTFNSVRRDTLTNLMIPQQRLFAQAQLMREKRRGFSGITIQEELLTADNGSARTVGLEDADEAHEANGVQIITATMRHMVADYVYDIRSILSQKDNPAKIYDYLKVKRAQAMASIHIKNESLFWGKPDTSATTKDPYGVFYSLAYNATDSTLDQFTGGNPTGFSTVYGQDTSVTTANIDRYRNFYKGWTKIQSTDFLDSLWLARAAIDFQAPTDLDDFRGEVGKTFRAYCDYDTFSKIRHMMEGRNSNLGWDLDMGNTLVIGGNTLQWVPALSSTKNMARPISSTSHPVLLINWDAFAIRFLEGNFMRETGPFMRPFYHDQTQIIFDLSWQTVNVDRRSCAMLAAGDPLA